MIEIIIIAERKKYVVTVFNTDKKDVRDDLKISVIDRFN
jgi:hypothetical protein